MGRELRTATVCIFPGCTSQPAHSSQEHQLLLALPVVINPHTLGKIKEGMNFLLHTNETMVKEKDNDDLF